MGSILHFHALKQYINYKDKCVKNIKKNYEKLLFEAYLKIIIKIVNFLFLWCI